jgi:hypothetical protein
MSPEAQEKKLIILKILGILKNHKLANPHSHLIKSMVKRYCGLINGYLQ